MITSQRARKYVPGAIPPAAAAAGLAQVSETLKEWGVDPDYGAPFGNTFAKHVLCEALEFGGSIPLHEDNRYFRSTDTGLFERTKYVVASVFVARNEAGRGYFPDSRFGAVPGRRLYPGFGNRAARAGRLERRGAICDPD